VPRWWSMAVGRSAPSGRPPARPALLQKGGSACTGWE
jgi:hypothetical protein